MVACWLCFEGLAKGAQFACCYVWCQVLEKHVFTDFSGELCYIWPMKFNVHRPSRNAQSAAFFLAWAFFGLLSAASVDRWCPQVDSSYCPSHIPASTHRVQLNPWLSRFGYEPLLLCPYKSTIASSSGRWWIGNGVEPNVHFSTTNGTLLNDCVTPTPLANDWLQLAICW